MKLSETFGFQKVPTPHREIGQQPREGRPNTERVKKRPPKNLWFKDDRMWKNDLDLEHGGSYTLVADENEERIVACSNDKKLSHGWWDKKTGKGITFKTPRPMQMVAHPKTSFKEYVQK